MESGWRRVGEVLEGLSWPIFVSRTLPPLEDGESLLCDGYGVWRRNWYEVCHGWLTLTNERIVFLGRRSHPLALVARKSSLMVLIPLDVVASARRHRTLGVSIFGDLEILCSTGETTRFRARGSGGWIVHINRVVADTQIP